MSAQGCFADKTVADRGPGLPDRVVPACDLPDWVPAGAWLYLSHVAAGQSLRALARDHGCHASTVLRQVRHFETRRDDPLVDAALRRLDLAWRESSPPLSGTEMRPMTSRSQALSKLPDSSTFTEEAMRALRDLSQPDTLLIVAADMPKAAITRDAAGQTPERVSVLDSAVAEAMALNGWITLARQGRVSSYRISAAGRMALRQHCARHGLARPSDSSAGHGAARRLRYGLAESPVAVLARRLDKDGRRFLGDAELRAAGQLRTDFIMGQLEDAAFETARALEQQLQARQVPGSNLGPPGTRAARQRVLEVLRDLGPDLGDVALRCCCRLEGVEAAEQALGWSARSGKIVLRIALQRMVRHYRRLGDDQMLIG